MLAALRRDVGRSRSSRSSPGQGDDGGVKGIFTLPHFAARGKASRRRPAAGDLAELGVIASGHASDIAPEIFVAFSGGAQRRIEVRTQRASNEGEHSCIDAVRLAAHEERLGPEKIRN